MSAPLRIVPQSNQVTGTLLHANFMFDEGLYLDLYGTPATDDDGYEVESIAVAGTTVEIGQLFRGRQMLNMSYWLDLHKGNAAQRDWADRYRQEAAHV